MNQLTADPHDMLAPARESYAMTIRRLLRKGLSYPKPTPELQQIVGLFERGLKLDEIQRTMGSAYEVALAEMRSRCTMRFMARIIRCMEEGGNVVALCEDYNIDPREANEIVSILKGGTL